MAMVIIKKCYADACDAVDDNGDEDDSDRIADRTDEEGDVMMDACVAEDWAPLSEHTRSVWCPWMVATPLCLGPA